MNPNQTQLVKCLLELANRADELGEQEMAHSILILSTATMTGETKVFKEWCTLYANAALERAIGAFMKTLAKAAGEEDMLDKNNNPDKK